MNFVALDDVTRSYMRAEVLADIRSGDLHRPRRLTVSGWRAYPRLLLEAVERRTPEWLALRLTEDGGLRARETVTRGMTVAWRAVPENAAQALAEDVFNRYYIRAVCLRRMKEGKAQVQVYRARESKVPRTRSLHLEGMWVDAEKLLADLRRPPAEFAETGMPPGPGSGLSVR